MSDDPPATGVRPRGYDLEVRHLKERASTMGDWALHMVHDGWRAFDECDLTAAQVVLDRDTELDRMDDDMEHATIAFLVLRQPAAVDLRTAAGLLKITTHLDRIGRLGFDMARQTSDSSSQSAPRVREILQKMDDVVEGMVEQALEAMADDEVELARGLFIRDDDVDRMHRQATRTIVSELTKHPDNAPRLSSQLLVARHFERIADNACKIAEKTIYANTGQRRAEYLPRHPYRPYALETVRDT